MFPGRAGPIRRSRWNTGTRFHPCCADPHRRNHSLHRPAQRESTGSKAASVAGNPMSLAEMSMEKRRGALSYSSATRAKGLGRSPEPRTAQEEGSSTLTFAPRGGFRSEATHAGSEAVLMRTSRPPPAYVTRTITSAVPVFAAATTQSRCTQSTGKSAVQLARKVPRRARRSRLGSRGIRAKDLSILRGSCYPGRRDMLAYARERQLRVAVSSIRRQTCPRVGCRHR